MGGKSKSTTVGYHYRPAFHVGLVGRQIDAFLEYRAADKTAWAGELTASGRIQIDAPDLFGGEKDQGGIVGPVDVMFGEPDQVPNPYLVELFGDQTVAWRGMTSLVFAGGRFGAMNPYQQKSAYKIRKILSGWDGEVWYPETARVMATVGRGSPALTETFADGTLDRYTPLVGTSAGFSIVTEDGRYAIQTAGVPGSVHNVIGRKLPVPAALYRMRTRFKVKAIRSDDAGNFSLRDHEGDVVISFGSVRDSIVDALRRPSVSFRDQPGGIHNPLGNGSVTIGEWYLFDATYDVEAARFACRLVRESDGFIHGEIDVPVSQRSQVEYLGWVVDDNNSAGASAGTTVWTDAQVIVGNPSVTMNPAHILYYTRTDKERGGEPRASINDASLRTAADQLFAEGFGLCLTYDPAATSVSDFEQRICRIIGGSFERSLIDGQWYLDLARGDYDIESLPIMGDADILEIQEQPTTLDGATNSIAVRYFDPHRKEAVITPAVRALGLIRAFGEIHETLDFPEIPDATTALMVADRELRARITPSQGYQVVTRPRLELLELRPNQYFRMQSPKRGIADMVCIVGERDAGTLRSGAVRWKVMQDIYAMPATTYVEIEHGVDVRPPQEAEPIDIARVFEAPYIDIVANLPRAELESLPDDVGYLLGVAVRPAHGLDYTMAVRQQGGEFEPVSNGEWCPTATSAVAVPPGSDPVVVPLATVRALDRVQVGVPVLIGDEILRLDAKQLDPPRVTLARACADTVPGSHQAGARMWFLGDDEAVDVTEYSDGETIQVKFLTNTGSQQLALGDAPTLELDFVGRQARPYPPANVHVGGQWPPPVVVAGDIEITLAHRDRALQGDQLIPWNAPSIGPEPGVEYVARVFDDADALVHESDPFTGDALAINFEHTGPVRLQVLSRRDDLECWQVPQGDFYYVGGEVPEFSITGTLPPATVGVPYYATLTVSGAVGGVTYSIIAGALPPGLSIDEGASSATQLVITGTPE